MALRRNAGNAENPFFCKKNFFLTIPGRNTEKKEICSRFTVCLPFWVYTMSAMWNNVRVGGDDVDKREYWREYYSKNKERIKTQERERARIKALAALESVKKLDVNHYVMHTMDGQYYIVCGSKS